MHLRCDKTVDEGGAVTEELGRDPSFRAQYDGAVKPDPEFEAALGGSAAPRLTLPPVTQPLGGVQWASPLGVRLR